MLVVPLLGLVLAPPAGASSKAVLHEPIPPDARDDIAMHVVLDGQLPAALETPSGLVRAPDPRKATSPGDPAYGAQGQAGAGGTVPSDTFLPDRATERPDVLPYEDPFTPSTAPFKRVSAFDSVDADYALHVRTPRLERIPTDAVVARDGSEEQFFADLVVDLTPHVPVRIPSVGPGARVVRAHLAAGTHDVGFVLFRDGADNWFVEGAQATRARMVMEVTLPRATFGGQFGDPEWAALPTVPPLPARAAASASKVARRIGVSRAMRPREAVSKLVSYFRSFADSEERPKDSGDVYLDLALSQKGVCRHRAFAFLVTALSLGLPTRMALNEAHAWVEVYDGTLWRRVDLGGAGRTLGDPGPPKTAYAPPPDPFAWPVDATRGEDLVRGRNASNASSGGASGANGASGATSGTSSGANGVIPGASGSASASGTAPAGMSSTLPAPSASSASTSSSEPLDERPRSILSVAVDEGDARRGGALHVRGRVTADGEPCPHVVVRIALRSLRARDDVPLGALASDEEGSYAGTLVVPARASLGDYTVVASTPGDLRCGASK